MKFRKEIIRIGRYVLPDGKGEIDVTSDRINTWLEATRAAGVKTYVPYRHSRDPRDNSGFVEAFEVADGILYGIFDITDEEAAERIASGTIRDVSIGVGAVLLEDGRKYDEVIKHVALVMEPHVREQGAFTALMEAGEITFALSTGDLVEDTADLELKLANLEARMDLALEAGRWVTITGRDGKKRRIYIDPEGVRRERPGGKPLKKDNNGEISEEPEDIEELKKDIDRASAEVQNTQTALDDYEIMAGRETRDCEYKMKQAQKDYDYEKKLGGEPGDKDYDKAKLDLEKAQSDYKKAVKTRDNLLNSNEYKNIKRASENARANYERINRIFAKASEKSSLIKADYKPGHDIFVSAKYAPDEMPSTLLHPISGIDVDTGKPITEIVKTNSKYMPYIKHPTLGGGGVLKEGNIYGEQSVRDVLGIDIKFFIVEGGVKKYITEAEAKKLLPTKKRGS